MKNLDAILTFDLGTTGLKCCLFDEHGLEVASATQAYPTLFPRAGWAEQNPEDYWTAAVAACRTLFSEPSTASYRVRAIGLSGHMNGCLPVDRAGNPVHPEILHSDGRSEAQCAQILSRISMQEFYALTGNRVDTHLSLPKILWIRDQRPEVYAKTAAFLNAKDYLRFKLCGVTGQTDYSDASLTCALDIRAGVWAEGLLSTLGLDRRKFPELRASVEIAGTLTREAAAALVLPQGTPVSMGGGDAACVTRGAGVSGQDEAYVNVGSSAWVSLLHDGPLLDPGMRLQNFFDLDGMAYNVCGTVQNASSAVDWALQTLGKTWAELERMVPTSPVGASGVFFLPYLMGERTPHWDTQVRGSFLGLSQSHTTADLLRAVLEGVAFSLRSVCEVYADLGIPFSGLVLTGGAARSAAWRQILGDVLGLPLKLHPTPLGATGLGAALAAGCGVGLFPRLEWEPGRLETWESHQPDQTRREGYDRRFEVFQAAYEPLKAFHSALAGLPPAVTKR